MMSDGPRFEPRSTSPRTWRDAVAPVRVGPFTVSLPEHGRHPGPDELVMEPGEVFGSGTHASTRLALAAVAATVRPGDRVLDVGCGTGVLVIGALLGGAITGAAVDIDGAAAQLTASNAVRNGVADRLTVRTGSVEQVTGPFDLIAANLLLPDHRSLAAAITALAAPSGRAVLAGFLATQTAELRDLYPGWDVREETVEGDWVALALSRR